MERVEDIENEREKRERGTEIVGRKKVGKVGESESERMERERKRKGRWGEEEDGERYFI